MAPSSGKRVARTRLILTGPAVEAWRPATGLDGPPGTTGSPASGYALSPPARSPFWSTIVLAAGPESPQSSASSWGGMAICRPSGPGGWPGGCWTRSPPANGRANVPGKPCPSSRLALRGLYGGQSDRAQETDRNYRALVRRYLADWLARPLDAIARRDVEDRFNRITANHGWSQANLTLTLLRSVYRRPCVDLEAIITIRLTCGSPRACGCYRRVRCNISAPAECIVGPVFAPASRPRWQSRLNGMPSGSASVPACGSTKCCRCAGASRGHLGGGSRSASITP